MNICMKYEQQAKSTQHAQTVLSFNCWASSSVIILIYFLAFLASITASPAAGVGPTDMYITYISVSKSTPLAVTGPHGQLASQI